VPVAVPAATTTAPAPKPTPPAPTPTPTPAPAPAPAAVVAPASTTPVDLIRRGSEWRYHDGGVDLGVAWRAASFADSAWKRGPAPLGFGDPWIRTEVEVGGDAKKRHHTTYFRRSFTVPSDRRFTTLELSLMRDDGAVLYLNGREIARSNMDEGTITYTSEARVVIGKEDEQRFIDIPLKPSDLLPGDNVLAVEIHQKGDASTDLGFDLGLVGK
jgi:hypothetical protein